MVVENVSVVDFLALDIPRTLKDDLMAYFESNDNSYHSFFPNESADNYSKSSGLNQEAINTLNEAMKAKGLVIPEDPNFKILLHSSY
jgi:hypothetical protein